MSDLELLKLQYDTLFVTNAKGRLERENDPDQSAAPLLWLAGCAGGNMSGVRSDLDEGVADEIQSLLGAEPNFTQSHALPKFLDRYTEVLKRDGKLPVVSAGITYELPKNLKIESDLKFVTSDSEEGKELLDNFSRLGLPENLKKLGFLNLADLWAPWCIALRSEEVASMAFAARLSDLGAELGVVTVPEFRGKGFAAAVTAAWASLPALQSKALFYSTEQKNSSSQRVIARLGLRYVGPSVRIKGG